MAFFEPGDNGVADLYTSACLHIIGRVTMFHKEHIQPHNIQTTQLDESGNELYIFWGIKE